MNQTEAILAYLRSHPGGLTQMEAYNLHLGTRLAARISDAKDQLRGTERIAVVTEQHDGGTHARYVLVGTGSRLIENMDEWARFSDSPHRRLRHRTPVTGCEWCIRMAGIDAVFNGAATVAAEEPATLWDGDAA